MSGAKRDENGEANMTPEQAKNVDEKLYTRAEGRELNGLVCEVCGVREIGLGWPTPRLCGECGRKRDTVPDAAVIRAMATYGGGFAKALAEAAKRADPENLRRIKTTWADYWQDYSRAAQEAKL